MLAFIFNSYPSGHQALNAIEKNVLLLFNHHVSGDQSSWCKYFVSAVPLISNICVCADLKEWGNRSALTLPYFLIAVACDDFMNATVNQISHCV